jgi:hypothetical protein
MISKPALTSREIRFSTQSPSHSDRLAAIFQAMDGLASWRGNAESLELSSGLDQCAEPAGRRAERAELVHGGPHRREGERGKRFGEHGAEHGSGSHASGDMGLNRSPVCSGTKLAT